METSKISPETYSALHLNISNLNKSFESFAEFYKLLSFISALSVFKKRRLRRLQFATWKRKISQNETIFA